MITHTYVLFYFLVNGSIITHLPKSSISTSQDNSSLSKYISVGKSPYNTTLTVHIPHPILIIRYSKSQKTLSRPSLKFQTSRPHFRSLNNSDLNVGASNIAPRYETVSL